MLGLPGAFAPANVVRANALIPGAKLSCGRHRLLFARANSSRAIATNDTAPNVRDSPVLIPYRRLFRMRPCSGRGASGWLGDGEGESEHRRVHVNSLRAREIGRQQDHQRADTSDRHQNTESVPDQGNQNTLS